MIRRPPRSTLSSSSAASDVYKRQEGTGSTQGQEQRSPLGLGADDLVVRPCPVGEGETDAGVPGAVADQLVDREHRSPWEFVRRVTLRRMCVYGPDRAESGTNLEHVAI